VRGDPRPDDRLKGRVYLTAALSRFAFARSQVAPGERWVKLV
jgi:hypothetical protein